MANDGRLQLLIVEDDAEQRQIYSRMLSGGDPQFNIVEAGSGAEGLALCYAMHPDCVILDFALPDLDGLVFLKELAGEQSLIPFPVVMLTGRGADRIDREAVRLGAQDYLEKGEVDAKRLRQAICRAIDRHVRLSEQTAERHRAEENVRALAATLEQRVEQRTEALQDSEARARAILNTAAEGIITFDQNGRIESFNPAAEPLFGYPAEEMIGASVNSLIPGLHPPTGRAQGERVARRSDGGDFPVEITLSQLPLGAHGLSIVIVRDITERKRSEEARKLFLAATSHDVRNALTVIAGYAMALADGLPEDRTRKALARIMSLAHTLSTMMSDIVAHASLNEMSNVATQPVSLRNLMTECAKDIEAQCQQKGLQLILTLPDDQTVLTDRLKLTRILQNLLGNAVRYTSVGEVELCGEVTASEVRLRVRDTGIGIPPADLPRIFDEYYRHDQARQIEQLGTGLGLATVRRFCEIMGGRVFAESTLGAGTTFTVVLPRQEAAH